jgi:hypothetical protein
MIHHQFFRYKYAKTFASGILTAAWKKMIRLLITYRFQIFPTSGNSFESNLVSRTIDTCMRAKKYLKLILLKK